MNKKKRRKWVRYERKHSMSLWQGDWKRLGEKWIIAFMDDASRLITCYGVFDSATTENTIKVLKNSLNTAFQMRFLPITELSLLQQRIERKLNTSLKNS